MKVFHIRVKLQAPGLKPGFRKGIAGAKNKVKAIEKVLESYKEAINETDVTKDVSVEIIEIKELRSDFVIISND